MPKLPPQDPPKVPDQPAPLRHPFRTGALSLRKPTRFDLAPEAEQRAAIAAALGLLDVPALRFRGEIRPSGKGDFTLEADLTARVVQPCAITLAPVPADIRETVLRRYLVDWSEPSAEEMEMPEDDSAEAMPEVIDAGAVALEALVLALPLYPRAPGAELGAASALPPGAAPIETAEVKPFAALAALKDKFGAPES